MQCDTTWNLIPNSSCVVIVDDGDVFSPIGSVHSRNKQLVGRRAAIGLIQHLYNVEHPTGGLGPRFSHQSLASDSNGTLTATISFETATLGSRPLVYRAPIVTAWSNSSRCPSESQIITQSMCAWLYIIDHLGQSWNATATIGADGISLNLKVEAISNWLISD